MTMPNQYEDTELKANVKRYVAALAESGDNFMKPQNIPADLRARYVDSLMQLIESEATRRQQAAEQRTHRIYKRELDSQRHQVEMLMRAHDMKIEPIPITIPNEEAVRLSQQALLDELEPMTHEGRGTIAWEMDAIATWIENKRQSLNNKEVA